MRPARIFPIVILPLHLLLTLTSCSEPKPQEAATEPPLSRFTTHPSSNENAAWSRDGEKIVFVSTRTGNYDIWIKNAAGGEATQLTDHPADDDSPVFSPDGESIAFTSVRGGNSNLWIMPAAGGQAHRVTADEGLWANRLIAWSPDGTRIAFNRWESGGNGGIWTIPVSGGHASQISRTDRAQYPSWSSDGKIAYCAGPLGSRDLWIVPDTGGEARQLTTHPSDDIAPSFSPDGRWLTFTSKRSGNADAWIMPSSGGTPVQVTHTPAQDGWVPRFSPDGKRISFYSRPDAGGLYVMPATGGERVRVMNDLDYSVARLTGARWSPDGAEIIFFDQGPRGTDLWRMPAAGGEPIQVTSGGFVGDGYVDLSFSPDGQSIAFTSNQSGNKDVWIVPAEGGEPRQVTLTAEDDIWLDFSPDGREIVFTSGTPDNVDLWVVPATGWTARNLVDWPTNEGDPQWSPDGERIAFTSSRTHEDLTRSIWVMPAGGGEATYVAAGQMPDWSPDGKTLLFIRGNDIWSIPAAGGKPARLTQTQDEEIRPRFSPDGSHILFSATRLQADIWIADVSGLEVLT